MIWIMVAHRANARLLKSTGRRGEITLVRDFDYPDGRRQNREIDTDAKGSRYSGAAGRGNASAGASPGSQQKHGLDPQEEAAEHVADIFAKELATVLRNGRTQNEFDQLFLVAESGFLGKLRGFLDKETAKMVSASLNKNLAETAMPQLSEQLDSLILENRKVA